MTIIKVTNCTVYYKNGKIRAKQNVRIAYKTNPLETKTKEELLDTLRKTVHYNGLQTQFIVTETSKIVQS